MEGARSATAGAAAASPTSSCAWQSNVVMVCVCNPTSSCKCTKLISYGFLLKELASTSTVLLAVPPWVARSELQLSSAAPGDQQVENACRSALLSRAFAWQMLKFSATVRCDASAEFQGPHSIPVRVS